MNSMIQTVDLTKKFNDFVANDHINLDVKEQEIKCIVGENGAGKSTMMNMLYGLLQPTSGKILIRGKEVTLNSPVDAIANGIGMVHQHFKLVPSLTVYENILLGAEITQKKGGMKTPFIDQKEEIKRVEKLIQENHLELNATDKIEDISVGGRQRVEILKMLYRNVDILILDEPTAVLTPQEVDELIATLKNLKEQGKTIIVITHKLREVMELADSITVIKQGKVVGNVLKKDTSERELAQMMVGRDVVLTVNNERKQQVESEIMYKAENLTTVNDYGKEVVSDMSFEVHKGEILGIAGVEGNGQSELVKLILLVGLKDDIIKNKIIAAGLQVSCYVQFHLPKEEVEMAKQSNGFVYLQAKPYDTQQKNEEYPTLKDCVEYLRSCGIERPIYCGVGVHAPEDVRLVREAGGDAAFVGSTILKLHENIPAMKEKIREFKAMC